MTWISARWICGPGLTALLILAPGAGCGDDDGAQDDGGVDASPARYEPVDERFEQEMVEGEVPGAVFAIVEGGQVTHAMAYGRRHPDHPEPVATTTLFRLASVTKAITAVGLLQQVQDGSLALDDPIVDHLPGFAFTSDATTTADVTVEHLLTHSSGIVDCLTVDATALYDDATALRDFTYDVFVDTGYLMAPPGRMFNYTNAGFVLAGLITELASGDFYGSYLRSNVLLPLGMDRTFFAPADVLADGDYATGQIKDDYWASVFPDRRVAPDTYDNPWGWPAGFAFSSVLDLGNLVRFLRDGEPTVLSDGLRAEMQVSRVDTRWAADIAYYGYGLVIQQGLFVGEAFHDLTLISHAGALPGFSSELSYVPECDLGFVTLANTDGGYFGDSLEVALETLCDLPAPLAAPDLAADPADLPDFVGTYRDPWLFGDLVVTQDGTELFIEIPSLVMYADYDPLLTPYAKDSFVLDVQYGTSITFIRDPSGQAEYLRSRGFVGHRVPEGAPPSPPPGAPESRGAPAWWHHPAPLPYAPLALPRSQRERLRRLLRQVR